LSEDKHTVVQLIKDNRSVMLLCKPLSCYLRNDLKLITKYSLLLLLFYIIPVNAGITVTDDLGNMITVDKPVKSIVTLSPHLTELVFSAGAGDLLKATVDHSDYPQQAKQIPSIGPFNKWDIEQILTIKPDIIFAWLTANGEQPIKRLKKLGLNVYVSEPRKIEDIAQTIKAIGKLTDKQKTADQATADFLDRINGLREKYHEEKQISVFYQVWPNPLMTINGEQLISRIIELCGGQNIYAELDVLAPVVTTESLIERNPQVIIGGARDKDQQAWLESWNQLPTISAVKNSQLYFINPDLLNRQTVRMAEGASQLCYYLEKAREAAQ
jgi:iron complex transport system substrate-binding protein